MILGLTIGRRPNASMRHAVPPLYPGHRGYRWPVGHPVRLYFEAQEGSLWVHLERVSVSEFVVSIKRGRWYVWTAMAPVPWFWFLKMRQRHHEKFCRWIGVDSVLKLEMPHK